MEEKKIQTDLNDFCWKKPRFKYLMYQNVKQPAKNNNNNFFKRWDAFKRLNMKSTNHFNSNSSKSRSKFLKLFFPSRNEQRELS